MTRYRIHRFTGLWSVCRIDPGMACDPLRMERSWRAAVDWLGRRLGSEPTP